MLQQAFTSPDPILISYILQHLEDHSIRVTMRGSPAGTGFSCGDLQCSPGELWVEQADYAQAEALINAEIARLAPPARVMEPLWRRGFARLTRPFRSPPE
jgi:hypothetical protein